MKYKKTLVSGATGTVGSNLNFGHKISSKDVDLRKQADVEEYFAKYKPDSVLHLAARVGGIKLHMEHKYELFYDNVAINTNIIESSRKNGVKRVLSYLSSCIYSDISPSPYTEKMMHDGEPFSIHYPYGYAKRMLEVQSRICYEEFGILSNCVIPTNIYGERDNYNLETGHVVAALIYKAFKSSQTNEPFIIFGDGKQKRDFIYTEDIAKLTLWALENYTDKEPLIFSNSTPIEIGYLATLIAREFNVEKLMKFDLSGPIGQKERMLSGEKLKSLTNFQFTPIELGIKKATEFFIKNYPNIRL